MKKIVLGILVLLFMVTAGYSAPRPPLPVTTQNIIGEWTKKYFLQNGISNSDPRWVLKIVFQEDNKFVCESTSTQEKWLQNVKTGERTTEAIETKTHLEGIYRLEGDYVFIKFTKDLNDDEKVLARVNLGYEGPGKDAVLRISLQKEEQSLTGDSLMLLSLQGLNTARLLFFTQENKANSSSLEHEKKANPSLQPVH